MNALATLPAWAALLVAILVALSALLALTGAIGLLRLKNFYSRLHAPTLGTTLGLFLMAAAAVVMFAVADAHIATHVILVVVFVTATTPITLMLLARAALARDRAGGNTDVPPGVGSPDR